MVYCRRDCGDRNRVDFEFRRAMEVKAKLPQTTEQSVFGSFIEKDKNSSRLERIRRQRILQEWVYSYLKVCYTELAGMQKEMLTILYTPVGGKYGKRGKNQMVQRTKIWHVPTLWVVYDYGAL